MSIEYLPDHGALVARLLPRVKQAGLILLASLNLQGMTFEIHVENDNVNLVFSINAKKLKPDLGR